MYMNDIKLFEKNEKELTIYSQYIRMEFGIEKCTMLIMRSQRRQITEEIELPNQERIRTFGEKETYNYLGILEADTIKQEEIKEKKERIVCQTNEKSFRNQALQ